MLDWSRIEELHEDLGEEDFEEIISLFLEEVENRLAELAEQRCMDIPGCLHFLKGSAANLGFRKFKAACETAEASGSAQDLANVEEIYLQAKLEFLTALEAKSLAA